MVDNENGEKQVTPPMDNETIVKLIAIGAVFLILIIYIIASGTGGTTRQQSRIIDNEELTSLFGFIKDNYTLKVEEEINGKSYTLSYSNDGNLKLYEGTKLDKSGYLVYNDKVYYMNEGSMELKPSTDDVSFMNDLYYNYDFISSLMPLCELESVNNNKVECTIKNNDYLFEYNKIKETSVNELEGNIVFTIVYNSSRVTNIYVDYTDINKALFDTEYPVKYSIELTNIGVNNFTTIFEAYKDVLQK